jgi:hypothetical protein
MRFNLQSQLFDLLIECCLAISKVLGSLLEALLKLDHLLIVDCLPFGIELIILIV